MVHDPGQVVLFGANTYHQGIVNTGKHARVSAELTLVLPPMPKPAVRRVEAAQTFNITDLDGSIAKHRQLLKRRPNDAVTHANLVMAVDLATGYTLSDMAKERARWYQTHAERFARDAARRRHRHEDPERIVRIAYPVGGFFQHSAMLLHRPLHRLARPAQVLCRLLQQCGKAGSLHLGYFKVRRPVPRRADLERRAAGCRDRARQDRYSG